MRTSLIQLENVDVALEGETILRDITWRLDRGQHWAVLGPNGSGKSTFLRLVRGELWPAPGKGRRTYAFDAEIQTTAVGVREKIGLVSPELQERYLQQEWALTGREVIYSGCLNTDYVYQRPNARQRAFAESIVRLSGVEPLLRRNVQQLSTGELRKLLIARALAGRPRVLILDEMCDGLDAPSRAHLLETIERIARNGTQILYTTHREEEMIPAITHALVLENGRIARHGRNQSRGSRVESRKPSPHPALSPHRMKGVPTCRDWPGEGRKSLQLANVLDNYSADVRFSSPTGKAGSAGSAANTETLIRIERADVFLEGRRVLNGLDWEMRADQNWVFFGPNGAGKSTLLKLIAGELHPAAGGRIRRFDLTADDTLWDIRKRIGVLSPELQANYQAEWTGAEIVASGFLSSIGLRQKPARRQEKKVRALMRAFGLGPLANKNSRRMSYGEFRKVLLLRALVNSPRILVCDEPFDGLDHETKTRCTRVLERIARAGTRLIIVTHHTGDLPGCMTHGLWLEGGRIVQQGGLPAV